MQAYPAINHSSFLEVQFLRIANPSTVIPGGQQGSYTFQAVSTFTWLPICRMRSAWEKVHSLYRSLDGHLGWQQTVIFLFDHRIALADTLLQPCAVQNLDMPA